MSLIKSTAVVSAMTLLSRVMGLLRDMVFTRIFGADAATDAFLVAFKIPNFLRRLFAEGAFSQAFVPVLTEYKTQRTPAEVQDLARHVAGTLALILVLITLVAVVAAPILVMIFAPGFIGQEAKFALTTTMLRITFPYILFISLTAFAAGILNSYGRFALPAFTPVLLNLSLIGFALWVSPFFDQPIVALAWGVFLAGVMQLAFLVPAVARLGLLHWPRWGWRHEGVRRVMKLMLPGIFGSSVMQINLLFDTLIASFLVSGSVTWLYLSDRMVELPLGVFGIALATVILPNLSEKHTGGDPTAFSRMLDWALRWVLIIGAPAAVGLAVLAGPILSTLFLYGDFTVLDVRMARVSLWAYSFGLLGFTLVKVLAPGYFARQDTRTPVRVGIIAMLSNMVLNIIFVVALLQLAIPGAHAGLALATSLSAFLNAGLLLRGLRRQQVYQPEPGWPRLFGQVAIACLVMLGVLWWLGGDFADWLRADSLWRITRLTLIVAAGGVTYFVLLWLSGIRLGRLHKPQS
ncbi:MAG: murein biosynthesis integral membrane protein MurJ [Proteobacteria bacterium]|jgi:putative peptidoglycan lipid II flippase|nr:murein biosynthesis integral membrane protein MurJ [Pseudomonadota bacterium]